MIFKLFRGTSEWLVEREMNDFTEANPSYELVDMKLSTDGSWITIVVVFKRGAADVS